MNSMMKARLFGLFALVVGAGGTAYGWYRVLTEGVYLLKASFLFPFFAFFGLSIMLYPTTKADNLARYGSEQISWRHMPFGQKLLIIVGVAAGALQLAVFNGTVSMPM